jgi:two-component system OmpR family response regulator
MTLKILVVDDERDFSDALEEILALEGFEVESVRSLSAYFEWVKTNECDLLILDRMLPDGDGIEILRQPLRGSAKATIFLTGMAQTEERIRAHDLDADYYLVKPVDLNELLALVRRYARRLGGQVLPARSLWLLDSKSWVLQSADNENVELTHKEMSFLKCFVGLEGLAVKRQTIIRALGFSPDAYDIRRLEAMVSRLRKKIEDKGFKNFPLSTVYGVGYAFNEAIDVANETDI